MSNGATRSLSIAALVVLLATACSGATASTGPAADAFDAGFRAKVLEVCGTVMAAKQAWQAFPLPSFDPAKPDPAKLPEVASWLESQVVPTSDMWAAAFAALGTPAQGTASWTALVTDINDSADFERQQIAAGKAGDAAAFAAATVLERASHTDFVAKADAADLKPCGDIVRS